MNGFRKFTRTRAAVSALVLVGTLAVVSGAGASPAAKGSPGVSKNAIDIGYFVPLTGLFASAAPQLITGVKVAFDQVNAAGGIDGRKLVLKTYDDGSSDAQTIVTSDRKAQSQVFAFLSVLSTTNQVLAPLANKQKIPLVYTDLSASIGKTLKYAFPAWPYLTTEAAILPSYIKYDLKGADDKIGVSYDDDATAIAAENVFLTDAAKEGLNVVGEQSVQTDQSSCTTEDTTFQSEGAQIIVQINGPISGGCMLSGASSVGYSPIWTGLGSLVESSALPLIAGASANGVTAITGFTSLETPAGKRFVSLVNKYLPGTSYNSNSLAFYGSAQLLIHGLKLAGKNLTRQSFVTAMDTVKNWSSGYQSPATFGPSNRSGPQSVAVAQVENGNWVTTDPTWRTTFAP